MRRIGRMRRALAIAFAIALIGPLMVAMPVAAVIGTTTTMSATPASPVAYGTLVTLHATVTANEAGGTPYGTVKWWLVQAPQQMWLVGTATLIEGQSDVSSPNAFQFNPGTNDLYAEFVPAVVGTYTQSVSGLVQVEVGLAPTTITLTGPATAEAHSDVTLAWEVLTPVTPQIGTVNVYRVSNPTPICTFTGQYPLQGTCGVQLPSTGTFQFYADYSGSTATQPSTSANLSVTGTVDVVHASGFVTQYSTFYPVSDTYRDTVKVSGFRDELLTVTIKVYSPGGTLLKTVSVASNAGPYSFTWNGRNSAGTVLPEGKYKFVHTLKDVYNNSRVVTQYVTLSRKKLIWHSASSTKNGSSFSASGHAGAGTVAVSTTYGYVRLRAPDGFAGDWAGAGWQFSLATGVAYRYIVVKVYAKQSTIIGPSPRLGSQNFSTCAYSSTGAWAESCFDSWKDVHTGSSALTWYSTAGLTSTHRYGRTVRSMFSGRAGTTWIYKARVTYQYATLGY